MQLGYRTFGLVGLITTLELINYMITYGVVEEFISNSLIILGVGLVYFPQNKILVIVQTFIWLTVLGLLGASKSALDLGLIQNEWEKSILEFKLCVAKAFLISTVCVCLYLIVRSVYYDGILLVLSVFCKTKPVTQDKISNV